MKVLLFGDDGQVGREMMQAMPSWCTASGWSFPRVDFRNEDALRTLVRDEAPELIINAAAYTAVDAAEDALDDATLVNADAPRILAEEAERINAPIIHFSTDFVFDGQSTAPYTEEDQPTPLSVYGQTKWEGDRGVAAACQRHLIFRVSWVYGTRGANFLLTIRRLANEGKSLKIVADQIGAPTWSRAISRGVHSVLQQVAGPNARPDADRLWGLYHMTCAGETSWHGFASAFCPPDADLSPCTTADYPAKACRPAYSVLDCTKLWQTFGVRLPHWRDALEECLADEQTAQA